MDYISNDINLANKLMEQKVKVLVYGKRANRPMQIIYGPDLDVSQILNPKESQEYHQFFGIAGWIVELGWVDILCEVLLLSIHLAMPRKGYIKALMESFVYFDMDYGKTIIIGPMISKVVTLT